MDTVKSNAYNFTPTPSSKVYRTGRKMILTQKLTSNIFSVDKFESLLKRQASGKKIIKNTNDSHLNITSFIPNEENKKPSKKRLNKNYFNIINNDDELNLLIRFNSQKKLENSNKSLSKDKHLINKSISPNVKNNHNLINEKNESKNDVIEFNQENPIDNLANKSYEAVDQNKILKKDFSKCKLKFKDSNINNINNIDKPSDNVLKVSNISIEIRPNKNENELEINEKTSKNKITIKKLNNSILLNQRNFFKNDFLEREKELKNYFKTNNKVNGNFSPFKDHKSNFKIEDIIKKSNSKMKNDILVLENSIFSNIGNNYKITSSEKIDKTPKDTIDDKVNENVSISNQSRLIRNKSINQLNPIINGKSRNIFEINDSNNDDTYKKIKSFSTSKQSKSVS